MKQPVPRALAAAMVAYGVASLVHFIHNAEFVRDYPGLPAGWTREGVYAAWLAVTLVGIAGWFALRRGWLVAGLGLACIYALLGTDSLGHYVLAPMSAHTLAMNATILVEVTCAALVLAEAGRLAVRRVVFRGRIAS